MGAADNASHFSALEWHYLGGANKKQLGRKVLKYEITVQEDGYTVLFTGPEYLEFEITEETTALYGKIKVCGKDDIVREEGWYKFESTIHGGKPRYIKMNDLCGIGDAKLLVHNALAQIAVFCCYS